MQASSSWGRYIQDVTIMIDRAGYRLPGVAMLIASEVPMGSGLSSSAALEVATAFALLAEASDSAEDFKIDASELAKIRLRAENEFVGVQCSIMDGSDGRSRLHRGSRAVAGLPQSKFSPFTDSSWRSNRRFEHDGST